MILWRGVVLSLFLISTAFAKESDNSTAPIGCLDTGYHYHMKTLTLHPHESGQEQNLYFFHNLTPTPLNLYQMRGEESGRSVYLNHTIQPNRWAVFATSEKTVRFICSVPDKKFSHGKVINCADQVKVCQFTRVRFGLNNKGNFWMVDNTDKNSAVREVVRYGIIP